MRLVSVLVLALLSLACSPIRPGMVKPLSYAYPPVTDSPAAQRLGPGMSSDRGTSSFRLVPLGVDAFALRAVSAEIATHSLDLQYYIWHDDLTGKLLAYEVLKAADRGVRVRLLMDDMDARGKSESLSILDSHPNIEVRLFNPYITRGGWIRTSVEFALRGSRLNRRMHNKAWLVDGRVAIIGGRNVGDEYFDASGTLNFEDLDLVVVGQLVDDASEQFDRYWNNQWSIPIRYVRNVPKPREGDLDASRQRLLENWEQAQGSPYLLRAKDSLLMESILEGQTTSIVTTRARLLVDDPRKVDPDEEFLDPGVREGLVAAMHGSAKELHLISPYFVPGKNGAKGLLLLEEEGVEVSVLTNSLAATDVAAVHSGYIRYRKPLLEGGVTLYEMKLEQLQPGGDERPRLGLGSSKASLHTKAAIFDDRKVFVGSFNLDPRSAQVNSEMGILIESEELARQLDRVYQTSISPQRSYQVMLDEQGKLLWVDSMDGEDRVQKREPDASLFRRMLTTVLSWLPIEPLL